MAYIRVRSETETVMPNPREDYPEKTPEKPISGDF